jgi:hypothetical protein
LGLKAIGLHGNVNRQTFSRVPDTCVPGDFLFQMTDLQKLIAGYQPCLSF